MLIGDAYGMFMACLWHVYGMFMACLWHVYGMFMACSMKFHDFKTKFEWSVGETMRPWI